MRMSHSLLCLAFVAACSSQPPQGDLASHEFIDAPSLSQDLGAVEFGVDGSIGTRHFKLARATLEMSGSASVILRVPRDVVEATVATPLPAGAYATYLRPGFELHEVLADGSERAVAATLIGQNPRVTRVVGGATESQSLAFRVEDTTVVVGKRDLRSAALTGAP